MIKAIRKGVTREEVHLSAKGLKHLVSYGSHYGWSAYLPPLLTSLKEYYRLLQLRVAIQIINLNYTKVLTLKSCD